MKVSYSVFAGTLLISAATLFSCNDNKPVVTVAPVAQAKDSLDKEVPDEFIELLFADQSMAQVERMASARTTSNQSVWADFVSASQLAAQHNDRGAIVAFRAIADKPGNESRMRLWAWNALQQLGVRPVQPEVLGIILEVPQQGKTEYLAMYADHTARYVNYSGIVVVWEEPQHRMDSLMNRCFNEATQIIVKQALAKGRGNSKTDNLRFSFLTTNGLLQAEKNMQALNDPNDPFARIFANGAQMLGEMVNKAKATNKR